ncbi:MAG: ScpA family protein [archaeon]
MEDTVKKAEEEHNLVDLIEQPAWKSILIDLVRTEKMNPWDIDLIGLAEKYLQKVRNLQGSNLRIPANAILASALLLRLKARQINLDFKSEADELDEDLAELEEQQMMALRKSREFLNQKIDALTPKIVREGTVTLDNLIDVLDKLMDSTKTKREPKDRTELKVRLPFAKEKMSERIKKIEKKLQEIKDSQGLVLFSRLLEEDNAEEKVGCFIPLLFLYNENKINLWQEEFFGEIFVSVLE